MKENTQTKAESEKLKAESKKNQSQDIHRERCNESGEKKGKGKNISHFSFLTPHSKKEQRALKKDLFLTSREKLLRAYGGCLGAECRRRTWDTAKSPVEL